MAQKDTGAPFIIRNTAITTMALGNPAPLGLLAFGMTTSMLMFVDAGWAETEFEELVSGYAVFLGGLLQILVAIFELCKGSSFSFAVFGSYGAFWLGWAFVYIQTQSVGSDYGQVNYSTGRTLWFVQWGIVTACFLVITTRKNICLIVVFSLLAITFFLLAAATATGNTNVRTVGGYFGFFTAVGAWYTGVAELVNEEWGRHVLPGLKPIYSPERFQITAQGILEKRTSYDSKSNTLFLAFRGMQIKTAEDVNAIKEGVEQAILKAKSPDNKVHVVVDYEGVMIADVILQDYWDMVAALERTYYLSARRFHVTSFGTPSASLHIPRTVSATMLKATATISDTTHPGNLHANATKLHSFGA